MVGRRVDALSRGTPPRFSARTDDPGAFDRVDPGAPDLPLYVSGAVDTFPAGDVVLSLNGVIAGTSEPYGQVALKDGAPVFVHKYLVDGAPRVGATPCAPARRDVLTEG
jgi:hypothetical protein